MPFRRFIILMGLAIALLVGDPRVGGESPPPPDAPKDFLDVIQWWCSYSIIVTVEQHNAGVKDGFNFAHDMRAYRRSDGSFHLDNPAPGGILPGHNSDKPDFAALTDRHRLRAWTNIAEVSKTGSIAHVAFDGDSSGQDDQPVEGKVHDTFGYESFSHGVNPSVKVFQPLMLVIDLKKKVYGLIFPYETINSSEVQVTTTRHDWEKRFDGTYHDSTRTETIKGVNNKPNMLSDATHKPEWIVDQPLPDTVQPLKGSLYYDVTYGPTKQKIAHVEVQWFLSPTPPEDLELILQPFNEEAYKTWRPKGESEDVPGRTIAVLAKLQKKGGGPPTREFANSITLRLQQTSREPGICINYPRPPQCKDQPDLQFRSDDNPHSSGFLLSDNQRIARVPLPGEKLSEAKVFVSSFDYAAFGLIEAKCELESGRQLTAHLKGDDGRYSLRLPKSREGSHIADSWREQYNAQGADDSDEDPYPVGDSHKGDGLTLFEEYRGYVHQGTWSSLAPTVKDFFVINNLDGDGKIGIRKFQDVSNLHVHELDMLETDFRVVNFNHSDRTHRVDQHAVILDQGSEKEFSEAVSSGPGSADRLGTPKDFDYVSMADGGNGLVPLDSIPHELLHCCNVYHHGDSDTWRVPLTCARDDDGDIRVYPATVTKNTDGTFSYKPADGASRIKLFLESNPDQEMAPPDILQFAGGLTVMVGMPHGQHSGTENCVMRYHNAFMYPKDPTRNTGEYFWVGSSEYSLGRNALCTGIEGYAINRLGRKPRPRYYEADANLQRGRCTDQIQVNDAVNAPTRNGPAKKLK